MEIVFTSSYKTYFKDNTKNYVTNYYVLVFLISVIFFFAYNMGQRGQLFSLILCYFLIHPFQNECHFSKKKLFQNECHFTFSIQL